jgi:hypothetical protein
MRCDDQLARGCKSLTRKNAKISAQPPHAALQATQQLTDTALTASETGDHNRRDHRRDRPEGLQHDDNWRGTERLKVVASLVQQDERRPEHPPDGEYQLQLGGERVPHDPRVG